MSAIGGRSESIGAAPDRSVAQQTSINKLQSNSISEEGAKQLKDLSQEEIDALTGNDAAGKQLPFGAELKNLFARKNFLTGLSNKFISAPSGANVDRKNAAARVSQLDQVIAQAQAQAEQNNADRAALEKSGVSIYSGSPLDLAFANKSRSINNIISQATSEKQGIGLQTDTAVRKQQFENFTVTTDKRNGSGRNRGVFDVSGRGGLGIGQTEAIRKQQLLVGSENAAIANQQESKRLLISQKRLIEAEPRTEHNSGIRNRRAQASLSQAQVRLQTESKDFGEKQFFTDQLLSNDTSKIVRKDAPNLAAQNQGTIGNNNNIISSITNEFAKRTPYSSILGEPVSFQNRTSNNKKSGTNSKGTSDKERQQFIDAKSAERKAAATENSVLSTTSENPIVKVANNQSLNKPRAASLYEALGTLNRVLGLPQFSGKRGANTQLKANIGALNQVQAQRISQQAKEGSRRDTKLKFESDLNALQNDNEINQKDKQSAIFKLAQQRDADLKGKTVTNTQFEQSRAGFAASRTNISSGRTVRSVQDFIDIGRKRRRLNKGESR